MAGNTDEDRPDKGRGKLDATGEFFSVGAPLHAVRAGYVKRRADDLLFETVVAGRYAHLIAPDRSGKSSLIAATAARLENNGCKVAVLDLEQIGVRDGGTDAGRWYYNVAYRLLRQLRIRFDLQGWWQDKSFLSNRQRLVEFYSEVVLAQVSERIVVFIDEIQCIEDLPYADQLLASIRAAHNARTTDPEFSRLAFVMSGECDPISLVEEPELSPFNVTQAVPLDDFSREDLALFATELNLEPATAAAALDRIYYWTSGQPYLTQKLARAVSREVPDEDVEAQIDHIASTQIGGRAALHSEPHMSHIHRTIVKDRARSEPLLNLYGKLRKGIEVPADLGSSLQRRLMAVGLVVIDADGNLAVRNRLYRDVFTARWANENLPTRLRVPLAVAGAMLLIVLVPFWYTQWLPQPYVRVLTNTGSDLAVASAAHENLQSFPGHAETADSLYRSFLEQRARLTSDPEEIRLLAEQVASLPDTGRLPDEIEAGFWDRLTAAALRVEDRDAALLNNLRSLVLSTAGRRQRAATLVADDYPLLLSTIPALPAGDTVFDPVNMLLTAAEGAAISQWSYTPQGVNVREPWAVTALEVSPLVRRLFVDREGAVQRIGLTLNISHPRMNDLRIKIIAPSGRTVEIETGVDRASSADDIRIPGTQLSDLIGESLAGTWSISVRDEAMGVGGHLVGWNLQLNSQGAVEYFQRGLNIPDPVEIETDNIWFDRSGRYAVARATQSDSARIWDLAFGEPLRAIAVSESESLIGLDASARHLVTATQDAVNIWETSSGDRVATLPIGAASRTAQLTPDGSSLFVVRRGDVETEIEVWSLDGSGIRHSVTVAGSPSRIALSGDGTRVAIADFDRAVRLWDMATSELLGQFDLALQPSEIQLSADGTTLGAVYAQSGLSLWNVEHTEKPLFEDVANGSWYLAFAPSGSRVVAGRPDTGFQIYDSQSGALIGPALGLRGSGSQRDIVAFSHDEEMLITGDPGEQLRVWRVPAAGPSTLGVAAREHSIWSPSASNPLLAVPGGETLIIGDPSGHVHLLPVGSSLDDVAAASEDVSYIGHGAPIRLLTVDSGGSIVASVAEDDTIRVWRTDSGEPLPWSTAFGGVTRMALSPNARVLGLLAGARIVLIDISNGAIVADIDVAGRARDLSFSAQGSLYVGVETGALMHLQNNTDLGWQVRQVWQGEKAIHRLQSSPRGDFLVMVDSDNVAAQFSLADGRLSDKRLELPAQIEEVAFDSSGSRVYFRTLRWVHRASSSIAGLTWADAVLVPSPPRGAGMVFALDTSGERVVRRAFLPVARNGYIELAEIDIAGSASAGLFGRRSELLSDWEARVSATLREGS